jgi:hypothetical protein
MTVHEISAEIWARFAKDGLAGITVIEFEDQRKRIMNIALAKRREEAIEEELREVRSKITDLHRACIHVTEDGKSAFKNEFCTICRCYQGCYQGC